MKNNKSISHDGKNGDSQEKQIANESKIKISVITVTYNAEKFIEETIKSVNSQSYENIEFIVVDGGSTDSTIDVISKYDASIGCWISEKDSGIYEAMNKGVELAHGDWIYFLGGDDIFYNREILGVVAKEMQECSDDCMLIFGKIVTDKGSIISSQLGRKLLLHNTLHHQSCFYRKDLFENFRYDVSLKMISDYELNLKAYLDCMPFKRVEHVVSMCRNGGASTARINFFKCVAETNLIRDRHVKGLFGLILKYAYFAKSCISYAIKYK